MAATSNHSQIEGVGAHVVGGRGLQIEQPSDQLEKAGPGLEFRGNSFRALGKSCDQFLHLKNGLHLFILKILRAWAGHRGSSGGTDQVPTLVDFTLWI